MKTITLCGSCRFEAEFKAATKLLTLNGVIAITVGSLPGDSEKGKDWYSPAEKELLDLVHFEKIRLADAILVLDTSTSDDADPALGRQSYVGFSTAREILFATINHIPAIFLSDLLTLHGRLETAIGQLEANVADYTYKPLDVPVAMELLAHAMGRQATEASVHETRVNVMQATLSEVARSRDADVVDICPQLATEALDFLGLEILPPDQREKYLQFVSEHAENRDFGRTREVVGA